MLSEKWLFFLSVSCDKKIFHVSYYLITVLGDIIDDSAEKYTDQIALTSMHQGPLKKSFKNVKEDADKLATGLLSLGLLPGDRVGQWFLTWNNLPNLGNLKFRKGNLDNRSRNFCNSLPIFWIFGG